MDDQDQYMTENYVDFGPEFGWERHHDKVRVYGHVTDEGDDHILVQFEPDGPTMAFPKRHGRG
jgi:hypothetical protein